MAPSCTLGHFVRSLVRIPGSGHDVSACPTQLDLSKVSSIAAADHMNRPLPMQLLSLPNTTHDHLDTSPKHHVESPSLHQGRDNGSSLARQQQKTITARARQQKKTATSQKSAASKDRGKRKRDSNAKDEMHQPKCKMSRYCENASQSHDAKHSSVLSQAGVTIIPQPVRVTLGQVHHSKPVPQLLVVHQQMQKSLHAPQPLLGNSTHQQQQNLPILPGIKIASLTEVVQQTDILRQQNAELRAKLAQFKQLFMDKKRLTSVVRTLGLTVI